MKLKYNVQSAWTNAVTSDPFAPQPVALSLLKDKTNNRKKEKKGCTVTFSAPHVSIY